MSLFTSLKNAIARAVTLPRAKNSLRDIMDSVIREKIKAELDAAKRSLKNKVDKEHEKAKQVILLAVEKALGRVFKTKSDNLLGSAIVASLMQSVVEPNVDNLLGELHGDVNKLLDELHERICKALKI